MRCNACNALKKFLSEEYSPPHIGAIHWRKMRLLKILAELLFIYGFFWRCFSDSSIAFWNCDTAATVGASSAFLAM